MTPISAVLVIAGFALAAPQANTPFPHGPLRNSFASAAESVIDTADAVEIQAPEVRYAPEMQQLHATYDRLKSLAEDDRETNVARALNDLLFAISACHLQATGGGPTDKCEAQVQRARIRSMEAMDKHRTAGGWVDGPPVE